MSLSISSSSCFHPSVSVCVSQPCQSLFVPLPYYLSVCLCFLQGGVLKLTGQSWALLARRAGVSVTVYPSEGVGVKILPLRSPEQGWGKCASYIIVMGWEGTLGLPFLLPDSLPRGPTEVTFLCNMWFTDPQHLHRFLSSAWILKATTSMHKAQFCIVLGLYIAPAYFAQSLF